MARRVEIEFVGDRLARRYAYQVLLLEEFARAGIEVVFAKEPERSGSPEDELLRQFQGMIAEYERAQVAERCRRGKLYRARAGAVSVLSNAPYGYRYVRKTEHTDAFFEIDELEAPVVREIFDRYVERRESIGQIARALSEQGVRTRAGTRRWGPSTIWAILRNPAYTGQAAYGRRRVTGEPAKAMRMTRQRGRHSGRSAYEHVGPEHWLRIPVPALINDEQHALAQERLERNSRLSPRNTRTPSLLCKASSSAARAATPTTAAPPAARPGTSTTTTAAREPTASAAPKGACAPHATSASTRSTSWSGRRCSRCSRIPS